jgi:hypothetical protein
MHIAASCLLPLPPRERRGPQGPPLANQEAFHVHRHRAELQASRKPRRRLSAPMPSSAGLAWRFGRSQRPCRFYLVVFRLFGGSQLPASPSGMRPSSCMLHSTPFPKTKKKRKTETQNTNMCSIPSSSFLQFKMSKNNQVVFYMITKLAAPPTAVLSGWADFTTTVGGRDTLLQENQTPNQSVLCR